MSVQISQKNLFMSVQEAEKILDAIQSSERKYRILLLLVAHGCRPGEACALNVSDFVSADCCQFYVDNTKANRFGKSIHRDLKIVPKWLGQEIKDYINKTYLNGQLVGGYLFPTNKPRKHKHMTAEAAAVWFCKLRKRLGFQEIVGWKQHNRHGRVPQYRISMYSFRRLFATEMGYNGVDQRIIATLMGHKDTAITAVYQDKLRILKRAPVEVEKMPRFFGAGQKKLTAFC